MVVIFRDKKPLNLLYITDKLSHVVIKTTRAFSSAVRAKDS